MDAPIEFIRLNGPVQDANSKFVVNEKALQALAKVEGSIAVVTIAGLYRTGKSFVLNQLAGKQHGFDIGATVEPCTEGLWMWIVDASKAFPEFAPKDVTLVLLDTEGLGSYQKTATHDIKIFALSVLLSSFFIYNSLGTIDDNAMDKLSLVVELSKHIRAKADEETVDISQLSMYFPKFMWLVRDFSLELISNGNVISADEYLENALKPLEGDLEEVGGRNEIRNSIIHAFRDRICRTLKRPVNDEELLQNLGEVPLSEFRPEYLEQIRELTEYVYRHMEKKRLYGHDLNGAMLGHLAQSYVNAINSGSVPTIASAWDSVIKIEGGKALDAAKAFFDNKINDHMKGDEVYDEGELTATVEQLQKDAFALFRRKAVGTDLRQFESELEDHIKKATAKSVQENRSRSSTFCRKLLDSLMKKIAEDVSSEKITTLDALQVAVSQMVQQYGKQAKGPAIYKTFYSSFEVFFESIRKAVGFEMQAVEEKATKKLEEEKEKSKKEYARLDKLYQTVDSQWKKADDENNALKEQVKSLQAENQSLQKRLASLSEDVQQLEELRKTVATLQADNATLRNDAKQLQLEQTRSKRFLCC